jgi:phytoene dehydrogenase-like protein
MKSKPCVDVIIVGAGLAGLACARRLAHDKVAFILLEADPEIGGRLKTENLDGYLLNRGFQVLQTAYPEAQRVLDFDDLGLKPFYPGAMVRLEGRFFRLADPRRRLKDFFSTLAAPIGTLSDRMRVIRLARHLKQSSVPAIFNAPDMPTIDFLREQGFSEKIIQRFFKPFFAGVCLDPDIKASSRVFRYIFRIFAQGDAALPAQGMASIARQLARPIKAEQIRTRTRVTSISKGEVVLDSGERVKGHAIVVATDGPETERLCGLPATIGSHGELCLYFSAKRAPIAEPYLVLNAEPNELINSLTVPSVVSPTYAPPGRDLISVVVLGNRAIDAATIEKTVRRELIDWFGPAVKEWKHLQTQRIVHALPDQTPPMPNPETPATPFRPGIYLCGEYNSVPGIQWALLSGRQTAERVIHDLGRG